MNLFQLGDFVLHSGAKSTWKIDCDALTSGDVECLAHAIADLVGPFASVEGIPRGGLRLAESLRQYRQPFNRRVRADFAPHLIVDDVLATGSSVTTPPPEGGGFFGQHSNSA